MLKMIVAMGKNREIGRNNELLWDIPDEMKVFREYTDGNEIVMGRKSFESISRPLPNRRNIVLTSSVIENVETITSVDEIKKGQIIIGGQQLYQAMLPYVSELIVSHVFRSYHDADAFFPEIPKFKTSEILVDHPLFMSVKYTF